MDERGRPTSHNIQKERSGSSPGRKGGSRLGTFTEYKERETKKKGDFSHKKRFHVLHLDDPVDLRRMGTCDHGGYRSDVVVMLHGFINPRCRHFG